MGKACILLYVLSVGVDLVRRQALLCHRVLRTVQGAAAESTTLDRPTWDGVLRFLLAINDTLLATPAMRGK